MLNILLVDDERPIREFIEHALSDQGHAVTAAADGARAMSCLDRKIYDLVICDVRLPKVDGLTIFARLRREAPTTRVILITAFGTIHEAVMMLKEQALDYLTKPFDLEDLIERVDIVAEHKRLTAEIEQARRATANMPARRMADFVVGQCPVMIALKERVGTVATSDCPILVTGESGTGKEVTARAIHRRSLRSEKPFVAVNCAAFPEALLEAELFGHERGAFTGAHRKRDGRFKAADGGTLFLDEIGELSLASQAKLLRVLQDGSFEPIGTNHTTHVDVRLISATNRNLKQLIAERHFREDLYYRLDGVHLHIPPLRERPGDLPLLVEHTMKCLVPSEARSPSIEPRAWAALSRYAFPGNIRELEHAIKHALVMAGSGDIHVEHLPEAIRGLVEHVPPSDGTRKLDDVIKEFEREYVLQVLHSMNGSRNRTAELLGISRKTLWEKLRSYGTVGEDDGSLP